MSNDRPNTDHAFLDYASERGVISALDAEKLRSEFLRRRATQKTLTMQAMMVHKGIMTPDQADNLFTRMVSGTSDATLVPEAPPAPVYTPAQVPTPTSNTDTLLPEPEEDTSRAPADRQTSQMAQPDPTAPNRPTNKRPTGPQPRPTDKRPTDPVPPPQRPTTRPVDDSRASTGGRSTTAKREDGWNLHKDTDAISATDKIVPAGTIIQASEMTIAMMRQKIGIDDGVKLVSDKMQSTLAQFQPDAAADRKRYVVVREIARGGMGKVLEVEDTELRRSVALKVLRKELLGRRDVVERFLEEAQITGQLEHPNIVPVHEMGVDGAGNLYFTMKFVEGLSLAEVLLKLREGNRDAMREYPLLRLLDVFIKICEGMSFAHNRGVIHRDLKPANIMVGRFGEVQVMDWGVAKVVGRQFRTSDTDSGVVLTDRLDSGSAHTMMGAIIGTPSYMSPEQAKGEVDTINHHSDIFSLGIILYEMLCLRSPWTGKNSDEVLDQVRELTPMKPRERNPGLEIPGELERLALKCLEKDPANRVDTVKELAENVRNFIEGRAMGSVDYSATRLAMKWIGRNKKEVAGVLLTVLAVFGGILGTLWYLNKLDADKVFGLNADARLVMEKWQEKAQAGEYDAAETSLDQAKDLYQKVLVVHENDATAMQGLSEVATATAEVRKLRSKSLQEAALNEQRDSLLQEGERALVQGRGDVLFGFRKFELAYNKASAALALDANSKEAQTMRATAANEMAKFFGGESNGPLMKYWIDKLGEIGLLQDELRERRNEYIRIMRE